MVAAVTFKAAKSNFMDETHNGRPITEMNK
jgi:hypothetical protein